MTNYENTIQKWVCHGLIQLFQLQIHLLVIPKAQAGDDIYKKIKAELLDLFGPKP